MTAAHPAPYSKELIGHLIEACRGYPGGAMFDPFAGIGRGVQIADALGMRFIGSEIEPEWAEQSDNVICCDSRSLPFPNATFDVICTSPAYGNRMADTYLGSPSDHAKGGPIRRRSYAISLGRKPSEGSSGGMKWGKKYRELHEQVWAECHRLLKPGGLFVLNCSDFIMKHKTVEVTAWHVQILEQLGLNGVRARQVPTRRFKDGQNRDARLPGEWIITLKKETP